MDQSTIQQDPQFPARRQFRAGAQLPRTPVRHEALVDIGMRRTPGSAWKFWHNRRQAITLFRVADLVVVMVMLLSFFLADHAPRMLPGLEGFVLISVENLLLLLGYAVFWHTIFAAFGLYAPAKLASPVDELVRTVGACSVVAAFTALLVPSSVSGAIQLQGMILFWLCSIGGTLAARNVIRWHHSPARERHLRRVLIVGSGPRAQALHSRLSADGHTQVIGFVDSIDEHTQPEYRFRMLGRLADLEGILMRQVVDEVLIALPIRSCYEDIQHTITVCEQAGIEARYLADIFHSSIARLHYEESASSPMVALKVATDDVRLVVKRTIDVVGAAVGLVVLAPVLLVVAMVVKLTSPGPIFFVQERFGLNKRRFRMYKFRTMVENAEALQITVEHLNEAHGPAFKIKDDPRLTRIGRLLRRTSLDELPQLLNVLRGEMSLVGPRPMSVRDVMLFPEARLMRRFSVIPGLTCLWQISGRSDLGFDDWIRLDLAYIDNWSLALDLRILLRTVPVVVNGRGAV